MKVAGNLMIFASAFTLSLLYGFEAALLSLGVLIGTALVVVGTVEGG